MATIRINIILFGLGKIGSALIRQVIKNQPYFLEKHNIELRFPVIANSTIAFFENETARNTWESNFSQTNAPFRIENIIAHAKKRKLENLIALDATSGCEFVRTYISLIKHGFDIVAANKTANIVHHEFYSEIRRNLAIHNREFLYETSVNPGLDVVNILKDLRHSGENVTKIRGTFSGSLSYIFNRFGNEKLSFSTILKEAEQLGYTHTDSRKDLSGTEIAEKLLILARELGGKTELKDIKINSLLLPTLNQGNTQSEYNKNKRLLDGPYQFAKSRLAKNQVLRYVGEFDARNKTIEVKLIAEPVHSPLGQLQNTENLIEIYTQKNELKPIIIQGTNLGTENVAKALIKDILKIANHIKQKEIVSYEL